MISLILLSLRRNLIEIHSNNLKGLLKTLASLVTLTVKILRMGCKSAAKFNLNKEAVASSSSLSLFFLKCKKAIQEQGNVRGGNRESDLDDEEEGEEGNIATDRVILFERSLRVNSGMSNNVDNNVAR